MVVMSLHNGKLQLYPTDDAASSKLQELAGFLEKLNDFVWEEIPDGISPVDTVARSCLGQQRDD